MIDDLFGRAREIDKQLPKAPWGVGDVSASHADIVDGGGNWIGTVRKDFDEDREDTPLIVELRNMLPSILEACAQTKPPSTAEIAEIEKWSRWSLRRDSTYDGQTLNNAIRHVETLLSIVHRQAAEIAATDKKIEAESAAIIKRIDSHVWPSDIYQAEMNAQIKSLRAELARSIAVTDEKIAEGEQWRDKWRKASADGVADRTEIERLQNALEAAENKLGDLRSELTIAGTMIVRVREEANQQRARAEAVEAAWAVKERWQKEAPSPGRWRVSIRPELRRGFPAVVECQVWPSADGLTVNYREGGDILPLDQDWFVGAKWQRIEEVADPFASDGRETA